MSHNTHVGSAIHDLLRLIYVHVNGLKHDCYSHVTYKFTQHTNFYFQPTQFVRNYAYMSEVLSLVPSYFEIYEQRKKFENHSAIANWLWISVMLLFKYGRLPKACLIYDSYKYILCCFEMYTSLIFFEIT